MAVQGYFYNSVDGDRKYNGQDMNEDKKPFYKEGVCLGQLQVTAPGGDMSINVDGGSKTGYAFLGGHTIHNTTVLNLPISQASGTLNRIDRVVLRNSETDRQPSIFILEGALSSAPVAPDLTNTDVIQDKCLAEVYVRAGAVEITQADITDTRSDETICGFVGSQFEDFDFSQFTAQFNAWFAAEKKNFDKDYAKFIQEYADLTQEFMDNQENEWNTWFAAKQDELSGDVAGKLQMQIDGLLTQVHNVAMKVNIVDKVESITNAITVTLTNVTTGTILAKEISESGVAFYVTEPGEYKVTTSQESVLIAPKAFTVTNADLMTEKTLTMREGSNMAYIGNYVGTFMTN